MKEALKRISAAILNLLYEEGHDISRMLRFLIHTPRLSGSFRLTTSVHGGKTSACGSIGFKMHSNDKSVLDFCLSRAGMSRRTMILKTKYNPGPGKWWYISCVRNNSTSKT